MKDARSIFDYTDARQLVMDRFAERARIDPAFSVRKIAREVGLKSHVPLLLLLQGKRKFHPRHASWLARALELNSEDTTYLQLLILKDRAKDAEHRGIYESALQRLATTRPAKAAHEINEEAISSDPIHSVILAATQTANGIRDIDDLTARFPQLFSRLEFQVAVERLLQHGLLEKKDGKLLSVHESTTTRNDVQPWIRARYHQRALRLAERQLLQLDSEEREFQTLMLSIPSERMSEVKTLLRLWMREFESQMGASPSNDVFQLSLQFVRLSARPPSAEVEKPLRGKGRGVQGRAVRSAVSDRLASGDPQ